jgi:hypothetical protein
MKQTVLAQVYTVFGRHEVLNTHTVLVLRLSCVPEKVDVNLKGINKKNGIPISNKGLA